MNLYMQISNEEKREKCLIQKTFLGLLIVVCLVLVMGAVLKDTGEKSVVNGEIDLEEVDFSNGRSVQLKGEWEYFDRKLIVTEMLPDPTPDQLEQVPSYKGKSGWGSYRVRLLNCPPEIRISVPLRGMPAASRVFINGKSVEKSGMVSKGDSMEIVADFSEDSLLPLRSSVCELTVEVSGRFFNGLSIAPVLMWKNNYVKQYHVYQAMVFLLFGTNLLFLIAYLMGMILTPESGYSPVIFTGLLLLLFQEASVDTIYSIIPGNSRISYDCIFLMAYLYRMFAWGIFIRWKDEIPEKLRFLRKVILLFCLLLPVLCIFSRCTWWWLVSDAAIGLLLVISFGKLVSLPKPDTASMIANCGMWFLWTGTSIGDLAASGYASFMLRIGILAGGAMFQLSIYTIDRKRVQEIQEKALRAANLETELERAKTEIALHQIKPHFLHNALMSIKVLCRRDPSEAEKAVYNFSVFLRNNMQTIESEQPIPFSEELKTIEAYLSIEQIRFGKKLHVIWDIQEKDFYVPPLTIQPLVENAVRHGICNKPGGGTVKISSYKDRDAVWILVEDDGVGFNRKELEKNGGIGIKNLRLRLENLLNAKLEIDSECGKGCRQRVKIPFASQTGGERL